MENGPKEIPVRENTGNLEILPKHREFGSNLLDSKDTGCCNICRKIFNYFRLVSFAYEIVKLPQGKFSIGQGKTRNVSIGFEFKARVPPPPPFSSRP